MIIKQILIIGPSSVGKTSYAYKKYGNNKYCIIDSDQVWNELNKKFDWDRKKVEKELYPSMIKIGNDCNKIPVFIDDRYDILRYLKREETNIIVIGAKLDRLIKNFYKRSDQRIISNVLKGWERFFEKASGIGKNRFLIKECYLDRFEVNTKADRVGIDKFIKKFFTKGSSKSWIKVKGEFDELVIIS